VLTVAKVRVKYLGNMRLMTGKESEKINAENLSELIDEIGRRYSNREMRYYLCEITSTDPSLIITHNGHIVSDVKEYGRKLKDGDEIILMTVIGGG
jgi:MoaD family protein